jgi:hypothetical protein
MMARSYRALMANEDSRTSILEDNRGFQRTLIDLIPIFPKSQIQNPIVPCRPVAVARLSFPSFQFSIFPIPAIARIRQALPLATFRENRLQPASQTSPRVLQTAREPFTIQPVQPAPTSQTLLGTQQQKHPVPQDQFLIDLWISVGLGSLK